MDKNKIVKYWPELIVAVLAIAFFFGTASFNYFTQDKDFKKWLSPDETANYIFAKYYSETGGLAIYERYNLYADDLIHPRSFRSDHGQLKPVSFLGLILIFGSIARWTSAAVLPYLTPAIGAIGLVFYYLLVRRIFGRSTALISSCLLAAFPPYIYYSARSFFHNVLFTVLLVAGLYFLSRMVDDRSKTRMATNGKQIAANKTRLATKFFCIPWLNYLWAALAGIFTGLAIITRSSELLWLAPLFFVLWLFYLRRAGIAKPLLFLAFAFMAVLPALGWNKILYGSYWQGGYPEMNQSLDGLANTSGGMVKAVIAGDTGLFGNLLTRAKDLIFHFGFNPEQSAKMVYWYFAAMFPWLFWPAIGGAMLWLWRLPKGKKKHWAYLASYLVVSFILIIYYGSWQFFDNPDRSSHTIGNSYTRYWLPVYLGALPFAALIILAISNLLGRLVSIGQSATFRERLKNMAAAVCGLAATAFLMALGLNYALVGPEEGLVMAAGKQKESRSVWSETLAATENNSVIITQYHDKLFFPERKVIYGLLDDPNMIRIYARLAGQLPVYYFNFTFPAKDLVYLNERRLPPHSLTLEPIKQIGGDFTLYQLKLAINPITSTTPVLLP